MKHAAMLVSRRFFIPTLVPTMDSPLGRLRDRVNRHSRVLSGKFSKYSGASTMGGITSLDDESRVMPRKALFELRRSNGLQFSSSSVHDTYTFGDLLGTGAYSGVRVATHRELGTQFAAKRVVLNEAVGGGIDLILGCTELLLKCASLCVLRRFFLVVVFSIFKGLVNVHGVVVDDSMSNISTTFSCGDRYIECMSS